MMPITTPMIVLLFVGRDKGAGVMTFVAVNVDRMIVAVESGVFVGFLVRSTLEFQYEQPWVEPLPF